ncbi:MAG: hypothetical protein AB7I25_08080 [Vicinamibacterales bacterium]
MERHVRILATLSRLWGGLALVMGTSLLCLAGGAAALLRQPSNVVGALAGLAAGSFLIVGLVALAWGGASLWCGRLLLRHTPFGRVLGLALGLLNLLVLPFGTALGAYALWVLLTHDGRALFHSPPTAA